ncbi:type VI secretion system-associated protein TagF [Roseomonas sp. PWR1]|uniref:Type VI secretion system-associated protein TagF n=1 Tax=Roseomonas nitratireducens TaxID=2820810 RepID=A0ABS4B111_9PROT|nr:type VI secretion system-associated protein TagF [Neoroseomonas nitratireducens]MBP0466768.1 type VI secretion system-associated protein TagF [Neoroseomonas nitratireducens]
MPDARPLTGLFGKVPAHGDFVRRGLPSSFVGPWDSWLQDAVAAARDALGPRWAEAWDAAPPWRFALPAGACGPDAVAGVMLPSEDTVGRRFPITLATLLAPGEPMPGPAWFERVEAVACAGRAGTADADALCAAIPDPAAPADAYPPAPAGIVEDGLPFAAPAQDPARIAPPAASIPATPFWAAAEGTPVAGEGDDVLAILTGGGASSVREQPAGPPVLGEASAPFTDGAGAPAILSDDAPDDALSLLLGGAPAADAQAAPDPVALLLGGAAAKAGETLDAIAPLPSGDEAADPLAALIGAGRQDLPDAFAPPAPEEDAPDPLAALIGAGAAAAPPGDTTDLIAPMPDPVEPADPLGTLIAAGGAEAPRADPFPPFAFEPADPPDASRADLLAPEPTAPPAPDGGGWWTRGAARLPPMVWALPALPAPSDFACLLEAHA